MPKENCALLAEGRPQGLACVSRLPTPPSVGTEVLSAGLRGSTSRSSSVSGCGEQPPCSYSHSASQSVSSCLFPSLLCCQAAQSLECIAFSCVDCPSHSPGPVLLHIPEMVYSFPISLVRTFRLCQTISIHEAHHYLLPWPAAISPFTTRDLGHPPGVSPPKNISQAP